MRPRHTRIIQRSVSSDGQCLLFTCTSNSGIAATARTPLLEIGVGGKPGTQCWAGERNAGKTLLGFLLRSTEEETSRAACVLRRETKPSSMTSVGPPSSVTTSNGTRILLSCRQPVALWILVLHMSLLCHFQAVGSGCHPDVQRWWPQHALEAGADSNVGNSAQLQAGECRLSV